MSIPQMVKDRAMVTIDARLEPHFSVTSFFFLQTSSLVESCQNLVRKVLILLKKSTTQKYKFAWEIKVGTFAEIVV